MNCKFSLVSAIILITLIISGCSKAEVNMQDEFFDHYSGELFSIVNQEKSKDLKNMGILYMVTLLDTEPSMREQYKTYNESNQASGDIIIVSQRTKIFKVINQNRKQLMNIDELINNKGKKIEYWVQPLVEHPEWLEAIEINIKSNE